MKPVQFQTDTPEQFEARALETGLLAAPEEDRTRQEFKDESDINWLLTRYGALPERRPATYGEEDFTIDLQTAHEAVQTAKQAFNDLDPSIRSQFASWAELAQKLVQGELPFTDPNQPTSTVAGSGSPDAGGVVPPGGNPAPTPMPLPSA